MLPQQKLPKKNGLTTRVLIAGRIWWRAVIIAGLCTGFHQAHAALLPINDSTDLPYVGVTNGSTYKPEADDFAAWLGRSKIYFVGGTLSFGPNSTWNNIHNPGAWFFTPSSAWVAGDPGNRTMVICTPMFPGPADRSGPTSGSQTGPVSFAAGAAGAYNWAFQGFAEQLVAHGMGNSIIRLGWEFNGSWYAWHLTKSSDVSKFVSYWKQIVNTMRSVPGAENLEFVWGGANVATPYPIANAYPTGNDVTGRPFVDYVGTDVYDAGWVTGGYPYPAWATTEAQKKPFRDAVWNNWVYPASPQNGLLAWKAIADTYNKPLVIPEFGLWTRPDGYGGGDNPDFIQRVFDFIQEESNNVYFAALYDKDLPFKTSPVGGTSSHPNAAAKLQSLLRLGLADTDIGGSSPLGTSVVSEGTYTSKAGGANIWNSTDSFNYAYESLSGDQTLSVRVAGLTNTHASAKAGIMIRQSTAANSPYFLVNVSPVGKVVVSYRATAGSSSISLGQFTPSPLNPPSDTTPVWIKAVKTNANYNAFYSLDGNTWTAVGGTVSLPNITSPYLAGHATCSLVNGTPATAVYDIYSVTPGSATITNVDVGGATPAGSSALASGTYTNQGGGADIWSTADSFNYTHQNINGDKTLMVRVTGLTNTHASAKAGIMIRQGTAANAANLTLAVNPAGKVTFTYRSAVGGLTTLAGQAFPSPLNPPSPANPVWLKLVKGASTYRAWYSLDGDTWMSVSAPVELPNIGGTFLGGLVVCSHQNGTPATAIFDSVTW